MSTEAAQSKITDPRPPSAWLLAWVASATLWITGELGTWIIPIQAVCYSVSYWTRRNPPAWRKSAGWLNVGMLGITSVTITVALQGSPATLSLAYFAALTQGLQLIDARPRKSEFLLVTLALFQVILAANLTDSVFYPPLLLVFVAAATWTLIVHTLRVEAARAGDIQGAATAFTPGLARATLVAVTLSVALALMIFMLLPRMRTSMLTGGLGSELAVSGFSDRVELGHMGRIRRDERVVLRVETLSGAPDAPVDAYWRGLAFDRFDGRNWSISNHPARRPKEYVSGSPRFGVDLAGGPGEEAIVQRIVREPVEAGVLFGAGAIRRVEGPIDHLTRDENGGLYFPSKPDARIRYTVWTRRPATDLASLATDRAQPPRETGPLGDERALRWTHLPELPPAIGRLAQRITADATSDLARVRAIETHLRRNGRYTDEPPPMGLEPDRSPVTDFLLGELSGHCEYFASGMVVLTRSLGLPARLVNGFAGGRLNRIGGFTEVTRADAHAWVEVHFEEAGWVRFDPTPPDLRLRDAHALSFFAQLGEIASVIELWWFQRVVDFDSSDQILALKSVLIAARDLLAYFDSDGSGALASNGASTGAFALSKRGGPGTGLLLPDTWILVLLATPLVLALVWRHLDRRRGGQWMLVEYERALRALARHDLARRPAQTARDFAAVVDAACESDVGRPFRRLTEAYLRDRFGDAREAASAEAAGVDLGALRAALRATRRASRSRWPAT